MSNGWLENETEYAQLQHHISLMRTEEMTIQEIEKARKKAYRALYFNPLWIISQLRNLDELSLYIRYYFKGLGMYLVRGMKHSH